MAIVSCLCGETIEADDAAALNAAYWSHTDGKHGDFKISDARRQNATEALLRTGGWDGQRAELDPGVEIRPLSPASREDYLRYFDRDAFPDNPAWASCYCISYNIKLAEGDDFEARTAAQNRRGKAAMIDSGEATGVLAYADCKIVGWCNASPWTSLPVLAKIPEFVPEDAANAGGIVCFVIAPPYRGQGLARKLLDGACDMLRDRGLKTVYAYPPKAAATAAGSYHGKLPMYLAAGFEETGAATKRYAVVRKAL